MRLFVDSSVIFAMCYSKTGAGRELARRAIRNQIQLVVSDYVFFETEANLQEKVPHRLHVFQYLKSRDFWIIVNPSKAEVSAAIGTTVDIYDTPIVAAAKTAKVDALASYDRKHLHKKTVSDHIGAPVVTPDKVIKELRASQT